ncbi:MAG: T9SS type A sorting domain-containing protein [Rhodothermaceae bacterium]|nr:T9SS type A sorting domain-containing protein [Rhodothermaceae bacterium]
MRIATRTGLLTCLIALWAAPAFAQDVTFQVDMNPYLTSCQFDPMVHTAKIVGSPNGWDTANNDFVLDDGDADGIYTGTFTFTDGDMLAYKFYADGDAGLGYEDATGDRTYTVTSDATQVLDVVEFADGDPVDECGTMTTPEDYEILFSVDMNVAIQRGAFDPMTQEIYVAGAISDWGAAAGDAAYQLTESSTEDNIYTGIIQATGVETPGMSPYKFITYEPTGAVIGWESGSDRFIETTGNETDADNNGFQELVVPRRFFDDVTFDAVLTAAATVTFEVDARPAYYVLEDTGIIPAITGAGEDETAVASLFLNGPAMWESDAGGGPGAGITDWLGWNGDLEGFSEFEATDADGDSVFTLTLTYPAGALRTIVGKWGVNGSDNEANAGNDPYFFLAEGAQTISHAFGAVQQQNGLYNDDNGPNGDPVYDPYLLIDGTMVEVVRSGGEADGTNTANEPGAELPDGIALGQSYPNPFTTTATIAYRLDQGQDISVKVYDLTGRLVATLAEGFQPAGEHTVRFDARDLSSGTYLYRLEADGRVVSRMMTVLQ